MAKAINIIREIPDGDSESPQEIQVFNPLFLSQVEIGSFSFSWAERTLDSWELDSKEREDYEKREEERNNFTDVIISLMLCAWWELAVP